MNVIFVFGSNEQGFHGAGSALEAVKNWGARMGVGRGRTGNAYALPTKRTPYKALSLAEIEKNVKEFLAYAIEHPELKFVVVRVGCGLAGYQDYQIRPFFRDAPSNCHLPVGWRSSI